MSAAGEGAPAQGEELAAATEERAWRAAEGGLAGLTWSQIRKSETPAFDVGGHEVQGGLGYQASGGLGNWADGSRRDDMAHGPWLVLIFRWA
jgi:hypothetical protein